MNIEVWVEDNGQAYRAVAQDIRNGSQFSFSTNGSFNGRTAGSTGLSAPQPPTVPLADDFFVHDLKSSLDVNALALALTAGSISLSDICKATLFIPGTHQAGSSLTDQTIACETAAAQTGATALSLLLALRTAGGAAALATIAIYFVGSGTTPATTPFWVNNADPRPTAGPVLPTTLPPFWRVPKSKPAFAAENSVTDPIAQTVLTQCFSLVAAAGTYGDPYDTCTDLPIFASGRSDTPEATDHDLEALQQYPGWIQLDYRPRSENPSPEAWYKSYPQCQGEVGDGLDCDEYPFYSTEQGGSLAAVLPSLKLIDGVQNRAQGVNYNSFLIGCNVKTKPVGERQFLAIPLPSIAVGVPTLAMCNGN